MKVKTVRDSLGIGDIVNINDNVSEDLRIFHRAYGITAIRAIWTDQQLVLLNFILAFWANCPLSEWLEKSKRLWRNYIFYDPLVGQFSRYYLGAWLESWYFEQGMACFVCQEHVCPLPDFHCKLILRSQKCIAMFCGPPS